MILSKFHGISEQNLHNNNRPYYHNTLEYITAHKLVYEFGVRQTSFRQLLNMYPQTN